MSNVSKSEMIATFTDYDNNFSPYVGLALRVKLSADVVFVYIGYLTEGDGDIGTETFKFDDTNQSIGVDAEALYQALGAMLSRGDRHAFERLNEGTLPADHPSLRVAHAPVAIPAVRVRA